MESLSRQELHSRLEYLSYQAVEKARFLSSSVSNLPLQSNGNTVYSRVGEKMEDLKIILQAIDTLFEALTRTPDSGASIRYYPNSELAAHTAEVLSPTFKFSRFV